MAFTSRSLISPCIPIFRFTPFALASTNKDLQPANYTRSNDITSFTSFHTRSNMPNPFITGQSCFLKNIGLKTLKPRLQLDVCTAAAYRSRAVSPRPCRHCHAASTRNLMQHSFMMPSFVEIGYLLAPVRIRRAGLHRTIVRCTSPLLVWSLLRRVPWCRG